MKYNQLDSKYRSKIEQLVGENKWKFVVKEFPWMIRIKKTFEDHGPVMIQLYWNKKMNFKVATIMIHPKRGKNQMFRPLSGLHELDRYLKNPRHHSGKGYGSNKNKKGKSK